MNVSYSPSDGVGIYTPAARMGPGDSPPPNRPSHKNSDRVGRKGDVSSLTTKEAHRCVRVSESSYLTNASEVREKEKSRACEERAGVGHCTQRTMNPMQYRREALTLLLLLPSLLLLWSLKAHSLVCPTSTPLHSRHLLRRQAFLTETLDNLNALNAEMLAVREGEVLGKKVGGVTTLTKVSTAVAQTKNDAVAKLLALQGCLSIANVLSDSSAHQLLTFINEENLRCEQEVDTGVVTYDERFGGVNCRGRKVKFGQRRDLYLPVSDPLIRSSLSEIFDSLRPMLHSLVGEKAMLHEVSSVISDPEAPRQCVHADTIVLPCPQYPTATMLPLYTFFVALQDVEDDMGHTVFLPRTNTPEAHLLWNAGDAAGKMKFLGLQPVVQSQLRVGDCSAFDSRVLHCGRENSSKKRRVLFYFTISRQHDWPLPNGLHGSNSMRANDRWKYTLDQF